MKITNAPVRIARRLALSCLAVLGASTMPVAAQEADPSPETIAAFGADKILLVGDSTTQILSGWGGAFCSERIVPFVSCLNLGRGGRSTKTYIAEGAWNLALNEMRVPGYRRVWVLIQFGHNDQGNHSRSTDLATEFPTNLRKYVAQARAAGATPVLVTPLSRRTFKDGKLVRDLDPWSEAVRCVATETATPLVDLNARSADLLEALGPVTSTHFAGTPPRADTLMQAIGGNSVGEPKTTSSLPPAPTAGSVEASGPRLRQLDGPFDYTHLGSWGAEITAMLVADAIVRDVPEMRPLIRP